MTVAPTEAHPPAAGTLHAADGLGTHRPPARRTDGIEPAPQPAARGNPPAPTFRQAAPRRLPEQQHEALMTAARRPDQRVPGRDDHDVYNSGQLWFRGPTLRAVHEAGYADIRPQPWDDGPVTWEQTGRSLFLTPAGRQYVSVHGDLRLAPRRIVIIACGAKKRPLPEDQRNGWPAGDLYTGPYHSSLRRAADALTDPPLIRIASAFHGLVDLTRPLHPYDVTLGAPNAITAERMAQHAAALGLDDAHVIFLGGRGYADLLRPAIPHLYTPLTGGLGSHRGQCRQASQDADVRAAWWRHAAARHDLRRRPPTAEAEDTP